MLLSEMNNKEMKLLKSKLKKSQLAMKALWEYRNHIEEIKEYIALDELTGASEIWNDLAYDVQKLLNTAPRYGGAFTTEERAIIRSFWIIEESDL